MTKFLHGFSTFFQGLRLLFRYPSLFGLAVIPILLTLIFVGGLALGSAWVLGDILQRYLALGTESQRFLQALLLLLVLFVAYLIYLPLTRIFLAPLSEKISMKTTTLRGVNLTRTNELGFLRAIGEGIKLVSLQLIVTVIVLLLSIFLPPLGVPLGIAATICFCGLDFLDVPLSVRGFSLRQKMQHYRQQLPVVLGFSIAAYLLLHIPIVNLLVLPVGVIGATILVENAMLAAPPSPTERLG